MSRGTTAAAMIVVQLSKNFMQTFLWCNQPLVSFGWVSKMKQIISDSSHGVPAKSFKIII